MPIAPYIVDFLGAEARVRYGLLLAKLGRQGEAKACLGEVLTQLRRSPAHVRKAQAEWIALPLYAILTLVALRPDLVQPTIGLVPLQVEGVVMTLLVFFGIVFAWALFTEPHAHGVDIG